jgi:hypothetical protein
MAPFLFHGTFLKNVVFHVDAILLRAGNVSIIRMEERKKNEGIRP